MINKKEVQKITAPAEPNMRLSSLERWQKGKELSDKIPLENQSEWRRPSGLDPISLIQKNDKKRLPFLLPIKYGRMAASAFAYLRGSAVVMAADLTSTPVSGITTMLCGDAHLSNFGIFASPERKLIFDMNDFDECYLGPWEWDLKRLAVSAAVAGRDKGFKPQDNRELSRYVSKKYRKAITTFANMPTLDLWYYSVDAKKFLKTFRNSKKESKILKKTVKKARDRTEQQSLEKLTEIVDGQRQFVNNPPSMVRLTDVAETKIQVSRSDLEKAWLEYVGSVEADRRTLLCRYHLVDAALRVVGVGSVGTRCFIALLEADSTEDEIVLQQKEAVSSVLERYVPQQEFANHADRVLVGQQLMQSASDIFLGWSHGFASSKHDFYWRQLRDMKGSVDVSMLDLKGFKDYLACCSRCLALGHARSGDAAQIAGYLNKGKPFDQAIADFSVSYAEQTQHDYHALLNAIKAGRIVAQKNA